MRKMYRQFIFFFLLALNVSGGTVEIGTNEFFSNDPFCGSCALSMRYQNLYLQSEMASAIEIQSISLTRTPAGGTSVTLDTLAIYMGYSSVSDLGSNYDDNYSPGTRQLVYWEEDCTITAPEPNQWFQIDLETPFFYDGTGNLIIEYAWPAGSGEVDNWNWTGTVNRSVTGGWNSETGFTSQDCPHILLTGTLSLQSETFGFIKALFAQE